MAVGAEARRESVEKSYLKTTESKIVEDWLQIHTVIVLSDHREFYLQWSSDNL